MSDATCGFCARTFQPDQAQPACASCPLNGGCRLVRCPWCGYENPLTPPWVSRVRGWLGRGPQAVAGIVTLDARRGAAQELED